MDKYYKLAQIIKLAGKELVKEESSKVFSVEKLFGRVRTDALPECIEVTNDGGYRSIVIGDTRGHVSLDNGRVDNSIFHKEYVYLYSANAFYNEEGKKLWGCRCFPTIDSLYRAIRVLAEGNYTYKRGRYINVFLNDNEDIFETRDYLREIIEKFADMAWDDKRSAEEIVKAA